MKLKLLFLCLTFTSVMMAQITFQGCPSVLGAQNFVLTNTDTNTDGGVVRNTYESTPLNFGQSCPAGVCEIRIIWNDVADRWEIQLDNDGPVNTPNYTTGVLYFSTTASSPNPPDVTSGSWQSAGFCPGSISTMNGDVDDGSTLGVEEISSIANQIVMYPNPTKNIVNIETTSSLSKIEIYTLLGKKILKSESKSINVAALPQGLYLIKITSSQGIETVKKLQKI
jgi:hypothetical protein